MPKSRLPTDPAERKKIPLAALFNYFDLAFIEVAKVIYAGNAQHNPGSTTMVWHRSKATDQDECLLRHFIERGTRDTDGLRHSAKVVWRALAALQLEMEAALQLPPSRASINCPTTPARPEPKQLELPFWADKPVPGTSPTSGQSADEKPLGAVLMFLDRKP